jgi:hypothetical protein
VSSGAKPEKALEGCPVADLELGLVIGEVVQRLQHQHLEHQRHVVRLTPGVVLALFLVNELQQQSESMPIGDAVEPWQRIAQLLESRQTALVVKETWLHAICPPPPSKVWVLFCLNWGIIRDAHMAGVFGEPHGL